MTNLIDPKFVTIQQLVNIFNNAYIKVENIEDDSISININDRVIEVQLLTSKIQILSHVGVGSREELAQHEGFIYEHINHLNNRSLSKFIFIYNKNNHGVMIIERCHPYTFGLNPAQLVEDCNIMQNSMKDAINYTVGIFKEKGIFQ